MTTAIQKWGNSQGIRIPKLLLESLHWSEDEELTISTENDKLVLTKASKRKNIKELFENFEGNYEPVEIDWGKPVGEEVW